MCTNPPPSSANGIPLHHLRSVVYCFTLNILLIMEPITTSLEWSKKLKKAGWQQALSNGTWYWGQIAYEDPWLCLVHDDVDHVEEDFKNHGKHKHSYSDHECMIAVAPTAEEILRRLPYSLPWKGDSDNIAILFINKYPSTYRVGYSPQWTQDAWRTDDSESLSDAAAACYCYLSENNLLPPK